MSKQTLILGPPGTGKTEHLMRVLETELTSGVQPNRIAFLTFTKKAAEVAQVRAMDRFNFKKQDLPYFRTLHSLAFQRLGLRRDEVLQRKNYLELGKHLGLEFSSRADIEEGLPSGRFNGDRYVFLDGYARAKCMTAEQAWSEAGGEDDLDWHEFKRFRSVLSTYKTERNLLDFSDMLEQCQGYLGIDVCILDEAQDLSALQWAFARRILGGAKRIYIAGDDDQAIFQWSGADIVHFQRLGGNKVVLDQSFRIPTTVHSVAESIASRIGQRYAKQYKPAPHRGSVEYHLTPDDVDLSESGTWLLLARNVHLLPQLVAMARAQGLPYQYRGESTLNPTHIKAIKAWEQQRKGRSVSPDEQSAIDALLPTSKHVVTGKIWHEALVKIPVDDREYYISLLRRGESLTKEPRVNISTIHGVKGGESDNVLLMTDMSSRTFQSYQNDPDSESRCFYVATTRTRNNLHIIQPQTRLGYEI